MSIRYLNRPSLIIAGIPKSYNFESLEASILTAYNDAVKKALILLKEILNEKIPAR
jgi:DNA-binding protein YbaB